MSGIEAALSPFSWHAAVLQYSRSTVSHGHGSPPSSPGVTSRTRARTPPPHVLVQVDHVLQSLRTQSHGTRLHLSSPTSHELHTETGVIQVLTRLSKGKLICAYHLSLGSFDLPKPYSLPTIVQVQCNIMLELNYHRISTHPHGVVSAETVAISECSQCSTGFICNISRKI